MQWYFTLRQMYLLRRRLSMTFEVTCASDTKTYSINRSNVRIVALVSGGQGQPAGGRVYYHPQNSGVRRHSRR